MYKIIGGDGQEYGPVSAEQLRLWMTEGRVNAQTRVQAEGTTDWKALAEFPELTTVTTAVPPAVPPVPGAALPQVKNHLVPAILCTVCCCLPGGVAAIVYAAQVNSKVAAGNLAGAQEAARKAKMWCWISFGVGLVLNIVGGIFGFLGEISKHGGFQ